MNCLCVQNISDNSSYIFGCPLLHSITSTAAILGFQSPMERLLLYGPRVGAATTTARAIVATMALGLMLQLLLPPLGEPQLLDVLPSNFNCPKIHTIFIAQ
jgi:hypothetical protein